MPIVKVPVDHKFGIVSLSRAEQLIAQKRQKAGRILRKRNSLSATDEFVAWNGYSEVRTAKNMPAVEITPAFVAKYNYTAGSDRDKLDAVIRRSLLHAKVASFPGLAQLPYYKRREAGRGPGNQAKLQYKAGLYHPSRDSTSSSSSSLSHHGNLVDIIPDVSSAWLELTLLCQCCGPDQEEVLLTLASSLNHAPLSLAHIPSLLYIAGLCYQWLKSDVISRNMLRSGELLLLKVLYLVNLRVFHHHLTGAMQDICTREQIRQLKFDLEGFENRERVYRNIPEALLHWKVALEVGLLVCEQCSRPLHDPTTSVFSSVSREEGMEKETRVPVTLAQDERGASSLRTTSPGGHGGGSLPAVLWHALDVWQCSRQGCETLQEAIEDFHNCSTSFHTKNWMESMLAMEILCTASQANINVLNFVHSLARGSKGTPHTREDQLSHDTQQPSPRQHDPSSRLTDGLTLDNVPPINPVIKDTRFKLPTSEQGSSLPSKAKGSQGSRPKRLITLNILGMQPEFQDPHLESGVTDEQTATWTTVAETATELSTGSKDQVGRNLLQVPTGFVEFVDVGSQELLESSVGTQSLIENETIPDIIASDSSSNTSVDLGSTSSLELGLSKSAGMFSLVSEFKSTRSGSKNLGSSAVSNELSKERRGGSGAAGEKKASVSGTLETSASADQGKTVESPLEESFHRVGLLDNQFQYLQVNQDHDQQAGGDRCMGNQGKTVTVSVPGRNSETHCTHYTHSTTALSGGAGILGSQVPPSTLYRHSVFSFSLPPSLGTENVAFWEESASKFENWPSEVALTFVLNMAAIAIYGRTSHIQRIALEGGVIKKDYGLLQLSEFETEGTLSKCDLSSWSVRHCAILGLSRVCRTCRKLPMKDGMSNVSWSKLMQRHSIEKDNRVLEAYKLSQACPDLDGPLLSLDLHLSFSSPLMAHIADTLAQLFLPPVTPAPVEVKPTFNTRKSQVKVMPQKIKGISKPLKKGQARVDTHLSPKVVAPPDFTTRTTAVLNRIAEEHWRRQMREEQEKEERKTEGKSQHLSQEQTLAASSHNQDHKQDY